MIEMKDLSYEELKATVEENRLSVGWAHVLHTVKMLESPELGIWKRLEQVNRLYKLMSRKGYALKEECFYPLMRIESIPSRI